MCFAEAAGPKRQRRRDADPTAPCSPAARPSSFGFAQDGDEHGLPDDRPSFDCAQDGYTRDATCDMGAYEYGASGAAGGATLSAAPDREQASVQLARLNTTSPRVVGDAPSALARPLLSGPTGNETWKVYYYAGAQLIAMRVLTGTTGNTLYYLHSDHLGSTSLTTSDTGAVVARQYYSPYGSVRSGGGLPTDIGFTGQRAESSELGSLMYFRARFYSPLVGRFVSADSIVPNLYNPQSLNRYSYALNDPLRYIDPSGHTSICGFSYSDPECKGDDKWRPSLSQYGITLEGDWSPSDIAVIEQEVVGMATALAAVCGEECYGMPTQNVFHQVFGDKTIRLETSGGVGCEAGRNGVIGIGCGKGTGGHLNEWEGLLTHEFGHVFDHRITGEYGYGRKRLAATTIADALGRHVTGANPVGSRRFERTDRGYRSDWYPDQMHPRRSDDLGKTAGEDFADMYMNWVRNSFDYSPEAYGAGTARYHWMTTHMGEWVNMAMQP